MLRNSLLLAAACILLHLTMSPGQSRAAPSSSENATTGMGGRPVRTFVENVFFVTNRRRVDTPLASQQFGVERAENPTYGLASVDLPVSAADDHLVDARISLQRMTSAELLRRAISSTRVLVYIPGFNHTLAGAVREAAMLARNANLTIPLVVVSWASQGSRLSYFQDEEEVELAIPMLSTLLGDLAQKPGSTVTLLCHSLGSRAVVGSLKRLSISGRLDSLRRISNVVFAAPDIFRDRFDAEYMPLVSANSFHTTLYVNSRDFWDGLSGFIHGHPRVGDFGAAAPFSRPFISTVDVSPVDLSWFGHSVFFDSAYVLNDFYYAAIFDLPPEKRSFLKKINSATGSYWRLDP